MLGRVFHVLIDEPETKLLDLHDFARLNYIMLK